VLSRGAAEQEINRAGDRRLKPPIAYGADASRILDALVL
jgi:hypothetical protein